MDRRSLGAVGGWELSLETVPRFYRPGSTEFRRKAWMGLHRDLVKREAAQWERRICQAAARSRRYLERMPK